MPRKFSDNNKPYDFLTQVIVYFHPDRDRTDREKLFVSFLANLFYALANLMMKYIAIYYNDANAYTTGFYRFIILWVLSNLYMTNRQIKYIQISEVKSKHILAIRIISAYIIALSLANSTHYLRLGTAISFFFISPVFTCIASIYFFKDKCKLQNVIGLTTCMIAMLLITNSESEADKVNENLNLPLGILWGTISLAATVAMIISTKMLVIELDSLNINYFVGKFSTIIGFIICLLTNSLFYLKPVYILLTSLNGLFFWCALYFMNISLKINNIIAVSCIGFLSLVYAFGFGIILFDEKLNFIDIFACVIIFSFNLYSIIFPVEQKNNPRPNDNNNPKSDRKTIIEGRVFNDELNNNIDEDHNRF